MGLCLGSRRAPSEMPGWACITWHVRIHTFTPTPPLHFPAGFRLGFPLADQTRDYVGFRCARAL